MCFAFGVIREKGMLCLLMSLMATCAPRTIHVTIPKFAEAPKAQTPLVLFSSALRGNMPYGCYSKLLNSISRRCVVYRTGPEPVSLFQVDRVERDLSLKFSSILAVGHSSGALIARQSFADKLVTIDPIETPTTDMALDGTYQYRTRMQLTYGRALGLATTRCDGAVAHALDPYLNILTSGPRVPYASSSRTTIKLKSSAFIDIFDEDIRYTLGYTGPTSDDFIDWLADVIVLTALNE